MKIRNGFVSNSSSSSFLVPWESIDFLAKGKRNKKVVHLTSSEVKKLKKYGFKSTTLFSAIQYEMCSPEYPEDKFCGKRLAYNVICNQDDVIYFLLKNNIGFEAACHGGDYTVLYSKGDKYFYVFRNIGLESTFGHKGWCKSNLSEILRSVKKNLKQRVDNYVGRESVSAFLKREKKFMEDYA